MPIGIKVEFPRNSANKPGYLARIASGIPLASAIIMARMIRIRVEELARPAQRFWGYNNFVWTGPTGIERSDVRLVSPRFPGSRAGSTMAPSGAVKWKTSAIFHEAQNARAGAFSTSGGMWEGLSVVASSARSSAVKFRSRSEGQAPVFKLNKQDGSKVASGRKVDNALKAASVLHSTGINVLALADDELGKLEGGIREAIAKALSQEFYAGVHWVGGTPTGDLAASLWSRLRQRT